MRVHIGVFFSLDRGFFCAYGNRTKHGFCIFLSSEFLYADGLGSEFIL